jgi:UPF0755 protein
VNGGYGGGRGTGRGPDSYGGSGYGDEEYGAQGYEGQGYGGAGETRTQPGQAGYPPSWDDSYWQQGQSGQSGGWPAQGTAQGSAQGHGQQDPRVRGQRPGAGQQQYDPRTGQQQYDPRTGPQPGQQSGQRGTGPQPGQRGTGPQPGQRGTGPTRQAPRGYGQDNWDRDPRESSFLPGFGRRDEFDGGRGQGTGRGGRYAGEPGYDQLDSRGQRGGGGGGRGGGGWDDRAQRRPRRGIVRRLAPWVALLVILTPIVVGGLYVYHLYENKVHPADYAGAGIAPTVTVQVKSGDTAFTLGPRLQALGVIASARAFELAAEASTNPTGLESGYFKLNHHMQSSLAWAALLNPKNRVQLTVLIPEGKRASQVALILAKATGDPAAQFQQVIDHPAQLGLPSYAKGKVEGFLFPATYTIQPGETPLEILQTMVTRFNQEATAIGLKAAAAKVGLTPFQVIIEASMAQAEGGSVSDYPKIARVIINRLHLGWHLQFDSTVLYGLGKYAISATLAQTHTPGPYNTYLNAGLPPGPISNPGDKAIQGILHPATGDWLYFITAPGGKSKFSHSQLK